jgi:hypothetical protein
MAIATNFCGNRDENPDQVKKNLFMAISTKFHGNIDKNPALFKKKT